jgi:hypothetical protein
MRFPRLSAHALNHPHACPSSHPPDPRGGRPAPRAGDKPRGPLKGPAPGPGDPPGRPGLDRPRIRDLRRQAPRGQAPLDPGHERLPGSSWRGRKPGWRPGFWSRHSAPPSRSCKDFDTVLPVKPPPGGTGPRSTPLASPSSAYGSFGVGAPKRSLWATATRACSLRFPRESRRW